MTQRPNILFVLADQLGARWLPLYGHPTVSTPHLNAFAETATVFERAITTSPICTPYRGSLLSGLYPSQSGLRENGQAFPMSMPSLAHRLNEIGYQTRYIGKWHLSGPPSENRWVPPDKRAGFQHFIGWESHHINHYDGRIWADDPNQPINMPGHETDAMTDIVIDQLHKAAASTSPFLLLASYQAPHPPCSPPSEYLSLYEDKCLMNEPNADPKAWFKHEAWNADYDAERFRQLYFGEISHLDAAFERLLRALDELGLRDNTLIVFTSDHGEMAGARGLFGKGLMAEEALHVPLIVQAPGQPSGLRTPFPVATIDLLPTMLDYADCQPDERLEGQSLRPCIEGLTEQRERIVFSEYHQFCATNQRWKLITEGRSAQPHALYDIIADAYELDNRLDDPACAAIQEELYDALLRWRERMGHES